MIRIQTHVSLALKDEVVLAYELLGVQSVGWFEDESSPPSGTLGEDGLPIASAFFVEGYGTQEEAQGLTQALFHLGVTKVNTVMLDPDEIYTSTISSREVFPFFITALDEETSLLPHTLRIKAATAFGSGEHPTTQGCLKALAAIDSDIHSVADVGCGSGILSLAAAKLWPNAKIKAVDSDPESVRITNLHSELNHVLIDVFLGHGLEPLKNEKFDVIVANILARPLQELAPELIQSAQKYIILSGFLTFQMDDLKKIYKDLEITQEIILNDWVTLVFRV